MSGIGNSYFRFKSHPWNSRRSTLRKEDGGGPSVGLQVSYNTIAARGRTTQFFQDGSRRLIDWQSSGPELEHPYEQVLLPTENMVPQAIMTTIAGIDPDDDIDAGHVIHITGIVPRYGPGRDYSHSYNDKPGTIFFAKNGDILMKAWFNNGIQYREGFGPQTIIYDDKGCIKQTIWRKKNGAINPKPKQRDYKKWLKSKEAQCIPTKAKKQIAKNLKTVQLERQRKAVRDRRHQALYELKRSDLRKFTDAEFKKISKRVLKTLGNKYMSIVNK
tara:strand:- start:182 stop:1000 length:819 start_codon:yes stop_codon:yes gene_type:complete